MAQFRFVADEPRQVSMLPAGDLRKVEPDDVFTVPDQVADSYECQPHLYELVTPPKTAAKSKGGE